MQKNSKNFTIWAALQSGSVKFFCECPNYYGGSSWVEDGEKLYKKFCEKFYIKENRHYQYQNETDECILKQILKIGIDYDSTPQLESEESSSFAGTGNQSDKEDIVKGTLVLNDGQEIQFYAAVKIDTAMFDLMDQFFKFQQAK